MSRDLVVPRNSAANGPVDEDGLIAELLAYWRPDLPPHGSDFQSFVSQVVELARILTGASGSAIAFRGEQGTICRARSGEGAPRVGALVDSSSGISKQCLETGTSLCSGDIRTDSRVDPEISQAVGIRAIAVVPIYSEGEISGILEVFSRTPGIFTDQHVKTLELLANLVGTAADTRTKAPNWGSKADVQHDGSPDIKLLVELEPAYRSFLRNFAVLASPSPPAGPSSEMGIWNDVLVDSHLPWQRFVQSVLLHIVVAGMLAGLTRIWPQQLLISPRPLREAQITYYPFSQSFPARGSNSSVAHQRRKQVPRRREVGSAAKDGEPRSAASTPLIAPPPAILKSKIGRSPQLGFGDAASVLPPAPDIGEAAGRPAHLPNLPVVAPPPHLGGGSGLRTINGPGAAVVPPSPDLRGAMTGSGRSRAGGGSTGAGGVTVVPPPPSINDHPLLSSGAAGSVSRTGVQIVGPPPSVEAGAMPGGRGRAAALGSGGSQVVPPPPSLDGAGNSVGAMGRGRTTSPSNGVARVVPPPPSIPSGGSHGGGGRMGAVAHAGSEVVPPPPSVEGGAVGNSTGGGRGRSLVGGGSEIVPPAPSVDGAGNSAPGGRDSSLARAGAEGALPPASGPGGNSVENHPEPGGAGVGTDSKPSASPAASARTNPVFQNVQLRVIGVAWAPPRSSYFSNYEVFLAEKWISKEEPQLIKLVYVFLPYQRRLAEYGFDNSKIRKLRVTRDPSCDESLMQITWPEGEKGPAYQGNSVASNGANGNDLLPCYRTTADDYRRAVSRGH